MHEDIRIFPVSENTPLHIAMAGISYCDGNYHMQRPISPLTVIEYVLGGEGCVTVEGQDIPVTADKIYILKAGIPHNYYSSAEHPWEKIFLNLEGPLPTLLLEQYGLTDQWLFDGAGTKELFMRIAQIVRTKEPDPQHETTLAALFFEIIARLGHSRTRAVHSSEAVRLKDYLDRNTERIVSNKELADHIYRSPDYCVKLFGREYGVTPYAYQMNEKMNIAKRLLRDTSLPIARIAASVGYHDPCYFSGLFRRMCGTSPREYRKEALTRE